MDAVWTTVLAAVSGSGVAGLLSRLLVIGRGHHLAKSVERQTAVLASLPEDEHVGRIVLEQSRRADVLALATISLLPAGKFYRGPLVLLSTVTPAIALVVAVLSIGHFLPQVEITDGVFIISLISLGITLLAQALIVGAIVDQTRERMIDFAMTEGSLPWELVRIARLPKRERQRSVREPDSPRESPAAEE